MPREGDYSSGEGEARGVAFTPGPWETNQWGYAVTSQAPGLNLNRTHGYGCDYTFVCILNDGEYHEYTDGSEQLANARLIAAAPDLHAALKALVAEAEAFATVIPAYCNSEPLRLARAALARATGDGQ